MSVALPLVVPGVGLVASKQAMGLAGTLVVAGVSGAACGTLLKMMDTPIDPFADDVFWECADDIPKAKQGGNSAM